MAGPAALEALGDKRKKRAKSRRGKDPDAPKPAATAFMLYSNMRRAEMKTAGTSKAFIDL